MLDWWSKEEKGSPIISERVRGLPMTCWPLATVEVLGLDEMGEDMVSDDELGASAFGRARVDEEDILVEHSHKPSRLPRSHQPRRLEARSKTIHTGAPSRLSLPPPSPELFSYLRIAQTVAGHVCNAHKVRVEKQPREG